MHLTDPEVTALVAAIEDAFNIADLRTMLGTRLAKRLDQLANSDSTATKLRVIVAQVVQAAQQGGWAGRLVEAVYQERPGNALVAAFYAAYRERVRTLPPDLYKSHEVRKGYLFANRKDLRDRLEEFARGNSSRVFAVNGPDGSGRAYSFQLIEHLAVNGTWYKIDHHNLMLLGGKEPRALLDAIFAGLGSARPTIDERDSRDVFELCNVLEAELNRRNETLCLVFSRFADANLHDDTRNFILRLAVLAEQKIRLLRVVLLGYETDDRPLPVEIYDDVLRERIEPLTPQDFAECAANVLALRGRARATAEELYPKIKEFFDRYPETDAEGKKVPDRLKKIESAVRQYIAHAERTAAAPANAAPAPGGGPAAAGGAP